jgi:light-harvesting complex 1 beta chain
MSVLNDSSVGETGTDSVSMMGRDGSLVSRGVMAASFIVVLVIALGAQALMLNWRSWIPGAEGERSVIGGVRAAVNTFMSYMA